MRRACMLISAAGAELSRAAAVHSSSSELRNLGQRHSTHLLLYSPPQTSTSSTTGPAIQEVGACGGQHGSGILLGFGPDLRTFDLLLRTAAAFDNSAPAADLRMRTRLTPPP